VLKQRIRECLLKHGGHASALYLARMVLHLRNAKPSFADRLLRNILAGDPDFASDGMGNWHLITTAARSSKEHSLPSFCIIETPMRPKEIAGAKAIVLGWVWSDDDPSGKIQNAVIRLASDRAPADEAGFKEMTATEFAEKMLPKLHDAVIVSWQITSALAALRRIVGAARQLYIPPETLSLRALAQNLLALPNRPTSALAMQKLGMTAPNDESLSSQLAAELQLWHFLLNSAAQQNIHDWQHLVKLSRQRPKVDFTSYHFDEKFVRDLPETPGVYLMKDENGRVIYVGKSSNLRNRVGSYFQNPQALHPKLQRLRERIRHLEYKCTDTELDALLMEQRFIDRFRPVVNLKQKIHAEPPPQSSEMLSIFLVPVFHTGRVIIYLLSPRHLHRVSVKPRRKSRDSLSKPLQRKSGLVRKVEHYCSELWTSQETGSPTHKKIDPHLEIASRWFRSNRNWISRLDPTEFASCDQLLKRLYSLIDDPDLFSGTVLVHNQT
jgi:hypothetical protein